MLRLLFGCVITGESSGWAKHPGAEDAHGHGFKVRSEPPSDYGACATEVSHSGQQTPPTRVTWTCLCTARQPLCECYFL